MGTRRPSTSAVFIVKEITSLESPSQIPLPIKYLEFLGSYERPRHVNSDKIATPQKPTQALILAGGRGTRLSPITDTIPKPMVEFHGRPFLEYLIEYLKEQGFQKIVLMLGYLPQTVIDYFGDGSKFGVQIEYSVTPVEDETGPRLRAVRNMVDPIFFLLYCDNYCPLNTDLMWDHFCKEDVLAQTTVYANTDKFTRNNLRINDGSIMNYDKSRTSQDLNGVDIGFAFLRSEVLDLIPDENINFEKEVYPKLVASKQLAGFLTHHRYYSVGNIERLPITEKFLKRDPVILLDRDGVLNKRAPPGEYVKNPNEFHWRERTKEGLLLLKEKGYRIAIISNQAGIARGQMTEENLVQIQEKMQADLKKLGIEIDAFYHCPHGWNDNCFCRKPNPGMLFQAQREMSFDLSRVYFIGDDERDVQAGQAAGCKTYLISEGESLLEVVKKLL